MTAAIEEIDEVGPTQMSMRSIARRAGVSHGAPAHHFKDKTGIFTALATEGFEILDRLTGELVGKPDAFVQIGVAYFRFALSHRSHFEVMFRLDLLNEDDPAFATACAGAAANLESAIRDAVGPRADDEISQIGAAAWSSVHGFATLWLSGNLTAVDTDPENALAKVMAGLVTVGEIAEKQLARYT
jgi:AcrR family transcriptional regulator